mgnify:CR=1 FL=1
MIAMANKLTPSNTLLAIVLAGLPSVVWAAEPYYWRSGDNKYSTADAACRADVQRVTPGRIYSGTIPFNDIDRMKVCMVTDPDAPWREEHGVTAVGRFGGGISGCGSQTPKAQGSCSPNKNAGPPTSCGGTNPINIFTGYKYQQEIDLSSSPAMALSIRRTYHWDINQGVWRFNSAPSIVYMDHIDKKTVEVNRNNHRAYIFEGDPVSGWGADADVRIRLTSSTDSAGVVTQWQLFLEDDSVERYSPDGRLLSITYRAGHQKTYTYDLSNGSGGDSNAATLDRVDDWLGNSLSYAYDNSARLSEITTSDGEMYQYAYNADGMLEYVSYPDETVDVSGSNPFGSDNPFKQYHYENIDFPLALTGITDEKSIRYATWNYDSAGRAISSEHANAADRVTLDYTHLENPDDPRVTTTNKLGKDTTYHFASLLGVHKVTQIEGHASTSCIAANKAYTYYADSGLLKTQTDWQGRTTRFEYNDRGLEIEKIQAEGSLEERVILTQWHADFNLKTKIISPARTQVFTYDTTGKLVASTSQPTTGQ